MSIQDRSTLKGYFNAGDQPTESQFATLIDSSVGKLPATLTYSATTPVCKYGPGRLERLVMNDPNTAGVITIYDNTSAATPTIATVTLATPGTQAKPTPTFIDYGLPFSTGLTVVTSTATNITVVYE